MCDVSPEEITEGTLARALVVLAGPLVVQNVALVAQSVVDLFWVGRLGGDAVAAVGLFVGVVLHELGHSLVAMRDGFPIESITLWIFGGMAHIEDLPEDWVCPKCEAEKEYFEPVD